jgi:CRP/FNR family transcriptional regulator, nitrogen oxide reductase regulator
MPATKQDRPRTTKPELFEGLSNSVCQSILSASVQTVFSSGQKIFQEGEPKQKLFLLIEGLAKVSQLAANGNEAILWFNVPGQVIGSLSCMARSTLTCCALAVRSCKVVTWNWPTFEALMDRFPLLLRNVQQIMVRQIAELSSWICEISTAPVEVCLASALIRMTDDIGRRVNGHCEVKLSQEALSQMIGTTTFYVNHLLLAWERRGLVTRGRGLIVIRDLAGLKSLCEGTRRAAYGKVECGLVSSHIITSAQLSQNAKKALGSSW